MYLHVNPRVCQWQGGRPLCALAPRTLPIAEIEWNYDLQLMSHVSAAAGLGVPPNTQTRRLTSCTHVATLHRGRLAYAAIPFSQSGLARMTTTFPSCRSTPTVLNCSRARYRRTRRSSTILLGLCSLSRLQSWRVLTITLRRTLKRTISEFT